MVWYILAALALLYFQTLLVGTLLTKQVGTDNQIGPRDDLPEPTAHLGRARRALANLQETLPIFLTIGILLIVYQAESWLVHAGGALYLAGRVGHLHCYLNALSPWRTVAYFVAMVGILVLLVALVGAVL